MTNCSSDRLWSIESISVGRADRGTQNAMRLVVTDGGWPDSDPPRHLANGHTGHPPAFVLSLFDRGQLAASDEHDELVPFGMAQLDDVVGLADPDAVRLDDHLR